MNTTSTFNNVLVVLFAALLSLSVSILVIGTAHANDAMVLTVRVVDERAVEQELGACQAGRRIVVVAAGRAHYSGYGASEFTVNPVRPEMSMSVNLVCGSEIERLPSRGVVVDLH